MNQLRFRSMVAVAAVVSGASGVPALAQHFDVYVTMDSRVRIGSIDVGDSAIESDIAVFGAELGEAPNPPGAGDEPGFFADAVTPGVSVGLHVVDALRVWDGADFDGVASPTMTLSKGLASVVTPGAPGGFAPGFAFATADGSGGFDDHPVFVLSDPGATGVYLLSMRLWTDAPGVGVSKDFHVVFNNGADEEAHDAAIDYWSSQVPSLGVGVLAALPLMGAARRRR